MITKHKDEEQKVQNPKILSINELMTKKLLIIQFNKQPLYLQSGNAVTHLLHHAKIYTSEKMAKNAAEEYMSRSQKQEKLIKFPNSIKRVPLTEYELKHVILEIKN